MILDVDKMRLVVSEVVDEFAKAASKHTPMHSHHEAYAVIKEEFEEYWAEVVKGGGLLRGILRRYKRS